MAFFSAKSRTVPIRDDFRFGEKRILQPPSPLTFSTAGILQNRANGSVFEPVSVSKYEVLVQSGGRRKTGLLRSQ
jgi:hypothetical protein